MLPILASLMCICTVLLDNDTRNQKHFCIQQPSCCLVLQVRINMQVLKHVAAWSCIHPAESATALAELLRSDLTLAQTALV